MTQVFAYEVAWDCTRSSNNSSDTVCILTRVYAAALLCSSSAFQIDFALRQAPKSLEHQERTHCRLSIIAGTSLPSLVLPSSIPRLDVAPTGSYSLLDAEDILYLSAGSERGLTGDSSGSLHHSRSFPGGIFRFL